MSGNTATFRSLPIAVLTVSDTRTTANDTSGDLLSQRLTEAGHQLAARQLVPDDRYRMRAVISDWIANPQIGVIVTSGGTGLTGRDGTPEALLPLFDKVIDGFGELFRYHSIEDVGSATVQSRCVAGVANATYIFCLPGSTGACRLAWDQILKSQLDARTKPCNFAQLIPRLSE